jgi:Fe-S-cluster containining protein
MHPCLTCGACCAHYRVAFHWLESDAATPGGVPAGMAETLDAHRLCMRGTHAAPIRCIALDADIGRSSRCTIHPRRPSVCRDVAASWESGVASTQCDRARMAHGLRPLVPGDWVQERPLGRDDHHDNGCASRKARIAGTSTSCLSSST